MREAEPARHARVEISVRGNVRAEPTRAQSRDRTDEAGPLGKLRAQRRRFLVGFVTGQHLLIVTRRPSALVSTSAQWRTCLGTRSRRCYAPTRTRSKTRSAGRRTFWAPCGPRSRPPSGSGAFIGPSRARPTPTSTAGHDLEGPRSAMGIKAVAIERCSDLAEPLCAQLAPVWELVASVPAPRCDHRQHEEPALA
jgi:hypothetical protein